LIVTGIDSLEAQKRAVEMLKRVPTPDQQTEILVDQGEGEVVQPDTEFVYPSGWKRHGFYMDKTLKTNLDNFLIPAVRAKWDGVGIISGMEGCFLKGTKILMANGEWKNGEEIKKGDLVMSPQFDGTYKFSKVIETYKWPSVENYSINEMHNGKKKLFDCSYNHGLPMYVKDTKTGVWGLKSTTAHDYFKKKKYQKKQTSLLTAFPIHSFMGKENCKVEPYTLGVFLGDGSFIGKQLRFTNTVKDQELMDEVQKHYTPSSSYDDKRKTNIATTYYFGKNTELWNLLSNLGLKDKRSGDKFIPKEALLSDLNYRIRLLSGLIDTDGSIYKDAYSIKTKSKQLAEDIKDLVYSIGGKARINIDDWAIKNIKNGNRYYRISFHISCCELQTKVKRKIKSKECFYDSNKIKIDIQKLGPDTVYGFNLDSESHMYITNEWCVNFNSAKSTNAMSIAKYLDPTFPGELIDPTKNTRRHCDRIVFTHKQFMEAIDASKPGQAIVFDEAIMGFMAADASTEIQKALIKKMVTIRKKNLYIFIVLPSIFLLRKYMAIFRTRYMIHFYTPDGISRGYFKFYSYESKRKMYIKGQKDFNQDADKFDFGGRATDTQGLFFDLDEYEAKKDAAIRSITEEPELKKGAIDLRNYTIKGQRDVIIWKLYNDQLRLNPKMTYGGFANWLQAKFGDVLKFTGEGASKVFQSAQQFLDKPTTAVEKKTTFDKNIKLDEADLV